jgi:hypothetical protein
MRRAPPSLVFAVLGQARADGRLSPEQESRIAANVLTHWALTDSVSEAAHCLPAAVR